MVRKEGQDFSIALKDEKVGAAPLAAPSNAAPAITLKIDAQGKVISPDGELDEAALDRVLAEIGRSNKDQPVAIVADEHASHAAVAKLLNACRAHGIMKFRLQGGRASR